MRIHVVQKGDSLWKIAKKYNVDHESLKKMNGQLTSPEQLKPGMKVKVPTESVPVKKSKGFKAAKKEKLAPKAEKSAEKAPVKAEKVVPKSEKPVKAEKTAKEAAGYKKEMKPLKKAEEPYKPISSEGGGKPRPNPTSGSPSMVQDHAAPSGGWSFHYPPNEFDSLSPAAQQQTETPQPGGNPNVMHPQMVSPAGFETGAGGPNANMYPMMLSPAGYGTPQMTAPAGYGAGYGVPGAGMMHPMMAPSEGYGTPQAPPPPGYGAQLTSPAGYGGSGIPSEMAQPIMPLPGEYGTTSESQPSTVQPSSTAPVDTGPSAGANLYPQAVSPAYYGNGAVSPNANVMHAGMSPAGYSMSGVSPTAGLMQPHVPSQGYYGAMTNFPQAVSPMMTQPSGKKCGCGDPYSGYYSQPGMWGAQPQMGMVSPQMTGPSYWEPSNMGGFYGMMPAGAGQREASEHEES